MKSLFIFFLLLFLNRIALTQETLTFDRALGMAMKKNHQIEVARNNAAIAENNATIGNADLLPNLNLSGGTSVSNREGEESTTTQALLSTSYALFDGFGNVYRFKRLQAGKRLGNLEARDAIESTLLQVSQAYYSASLTFENLRIANDLMTISRERFIRTRKRSDFGQARTIDVLAAQVDLNADSVTMVQARFQWDEARRNLNILLNRDVETDFLVDTAVVFLQALNPETLMAEALNQNASYLSEAERLKQTRYDLGVARSTHLPRLDLSASYGLNQIITGVDVRLNDPAKSFTVGATVSFSLFNGLKAHIQRQNAQIAVHNQELLKNQARLNLEKDVISTFEAYQNSRLVLELEKHNLEVAVINFQRTEELYQLGRVTTTQFREAQLNLIQAKSGLSAAKYSAKLNEIVLLRLSGRLIQWRG